MSSNYQEEFNKQLAEQLQGVRKAQPNHIPVYAMKYKNGSKYLIEELEESLALFPKKFKLKSVHQMIQKQSIKYCKDKLKTDKKVIVEGQNFKVPEFFMYTIEMNSVNDNEEQKKSKSSQNTQGSLGKFVKLSLEMSYQEAFDKYGRENVLTIVYTDATEVRRQYQKAAVTVAEKWLKRIIVVILILVIIPYLMRSEESMFDSFQNIENKNKTISNNSSINELSNEKFIVQDSIDIEDQLNTDLSEQEKVEVIQQRTIQYDQQTL